MKMIKTKEGYAFENAQIIFSNFSGRPDKYNAEGRRNFCIIIDSPEDAERLMSEGWNVKTLRPRDEGDEPQHYIQIKVALGSRRPPHIYMMTRKAKIVINEDRIDNLDNADIISADAVVRPYEWEPGRISAYLQELYVTIAEDYFGEKYAKYDDPDAIGPSEDDDELPF